MCHFVGKDLNAQVAKYAFEVVLRLAKNNKKAFLSEEGVKWATPSRKRALGQAYCEGFAIGINKAVFQFAEHITKEDGDSHTNFMQECMGRSVGEANPKSKLSSENDSGILFAAQKGRAVGETVEINNAVGADKRQALEHLQT